MAPGIYEPLNSRSGEIRLVRLHRCSDGSSPVCCTMFKARLSSMPDYRALSYCWGDPDVKLEIELNGSPFFVTENLFYALKRLRTFEWDGLELTIWIDAICINQDDILERNGQIRHMRNIYEQAQEVLVWLGEETENSRLGIELVRSWGAQMKTDFDNPVSFLEDIPNAFDGDAWEAAQQLFQRPYWSRIWIYQEIVVSRQATIICGSAQVSCLHLFFATHAWSSIEKNFLSHMTIPQRIQMKSITSAVDCICIDWLHRKMSKDNTRLIDLQALLAATSSFLSTDPRDKVYALLGMDEIMEAKIQADYGKAISLVYAETVQAIIDKERKLDILSGAGIGEAKADPPLNLPSWVRDFRALPASTRTSSLRMSFKAAGGTTSAVQFSTDLKVMKVQGILYDAVDGVRPYSKINPFLFSEGRDLALRRNVPLHPTGISLMSAYFRTIIVERPSDGFGTSRFRDLEAGKTFCELLIGHWVNYQESGQGQADLVRKEAIEILRPYFGTPECPDPRIWFDSADEESLIKTAAHYFRRCDSPTRNRSFFSTEQGYFGLGPPGVMDGDSICILSGFSQPAVVRPVDNHFLLVGECYIYGLMNGEVLEQASTITQKKKEFTFQ